MKKTIKSIAHLLSHDQIVLTLATLPCCYFIGQVLVTMFDKIVHAI